MLLDMKSATVREVQHNLGTVLEKVQKGQEVTITKRGKIVAKLVPAHPRSKKLEWPDFERRLKKRFPGGPPLGKPLSEVILEIREERF